jgi:hypothetical protein
VTIENERRFSVAQLTIRLLAIPVLTLGLIVAAACDDEPENAEIAGDIDRRAEVVALLERLQTELNRDAGDLTPERKEALLERCIDALEEVRAIGDPDEALVGDFCDSLEDTNPNTPAAWDDIRRRLDELIERFRG